MRLYTDEKEKLLAVWLSKEEHGNPDIMTPLHRILAQYKAMHYQPVIYCSGEENLAENTAALLCHTRRKMANNS